MWEQFETEALGWTDRRVYVRLPDSRWRFTSAWLDAADVKRRGDPGGARQTFGHEVSLNTNNCGPVSTVDAANAITAATARSMRRVESLCSLTIRCPRESFLERRGSYCCLRTGPHAASLRS